MDRRARVLFLSHSASRNGASILLLHFLRWLIPRVDWEVEVFVAGGGPLLDEFRSVARTRVIRSLAPVVALLPQRHRALVARSIAATYCAGLLAGRRFDLIYANTSAVWPLVAALRHRGPVLWHVHELRYALRLTLGNENGKAMLSLPERFIAVSRSVMDSLAQDFDVPRTKVDLVHGFVPVPGLTAEERAQRRQRARRALGWPTDAFVVGGCGSLGWRKGSDLFLQIARRMGKADGWGNLRFLWVGGDGTGREGFEFDHDLGFFGLGSCCRRVPTTADIVDYYCAMDLFALTSREDPFPLVMLEAGALHVPTICFEGSGGGEEFATGGAGLVVPYADVDGFAAAIEALQDDPGRRAKLGESAAERVRLHHVVDIQGPKLVACIERCLHDSGGRASVDENAVRWRI